MSELNVYQALAAVQSDLKAVGKDGVSKAGGTYNYRGIDAVINALHPLLSKHGLVIAPTVVEHSLQPFQGYSKPHTITTLTVDYNVYGPDGSKLDPPVRSVGYGIDNTDKGPGKAMSYAYKTAIAQLFSLPTDDPSMDNEQTPVPTHTMTNADVSEVLSLCEQMPEAACAKLSGWVTSKLGVSFDFRGLSSLPEEVGERVLVNARKALQTQLDMQATVQAPAVAPVEVAPVGIDHADVKDAVEALTEPRFAAFEDWLQAEGLKSLNARTNPSHLQRMWSWLQADTGAEPFGVELARADAELDGQGMVNK